MPERYSINPGWTLIVAAIAIFCASLVGFKLFQKQQRFEAIQIELKRTTARAAELEEHAARLSFDREEAVRQRLNLHEKLDKANTTIRDLQSKLDQSTSLNNELKDELVKTRSQFEDKQSRLDALQSEVESLKQILDEANAKTKNANAKRDEL
jgi:chromosome segregation ATPase